MLYQIVALLLEVGVGLVAGTCLLRLYMQWLRIPLSARSGNPLGKFVFALTDWLVLPLRRVLPAVGALDTASLVGAFLLELAQFSLLWALTGFAAPLASVLVLAVLGLVRLVISGLTALVIAHAVLSWIPSNGYSPFADLVQRLAAPVLAPIRKVLPLFGGVDLSPLVLLVGLQVLLIFLGSLQVGLLGWVSY
ncbi:MAG: YggT family protein [Rhodoferax sp.]